MSRAMHDEWIKIVIGTSHSERFETLLSFLENWKIRIEYQSAIIRSESQSADQTADIRSESETADIYSKCQTADMNFSAEDTSISKTRTCLIYRLCEHPV